VIPAATAPSPSGQSAGQGPWARGAEWYEFDPGTGLITEIRAYLASPPAAGATRLELEGFPYAERGYTTDS
jgi:hypothetical protein